MVDRTSKYVEGTKNGKWDDDENAKYIAFLEYHKE